MRKGILIGVVGGNLRRNLLRRGGVRPRIRSRNRSRACERRRDQSHSGRDGRGHPRPSALTGLLASKAPVTDFARCRPGVGVIVVVVALAVALVGCSAGSSTSGTNTGTGPSTVSEGGTGSATATRAKHKHRRGPSRCPKITETASPVVRSPAMS